MVRSDWVLIALASGNRETLSPVQLQKTMFLLGENYPPKVVGHDFYTFIPHYFGPFSAQVYDDVRSLNSDGLVVISNNGRYDEYTITPSGFERAKTLRDQIPDKMKTYLDALVSWMSRHSFQEIIREIYDRYPAFKVNSVFRG